MRVRWISTVLLGVAGVMLRRAAHLFLGNSVADLRSRLRHAYARYLNEEPPCEALVTALIVAEDHRFEAHCGLDVFALIRALSKLLFCGTVEGASTIEQQLVRTLTGQRQRTAARKCREILLATVVAEEISKGHVPGLYLSVAYFGWGTNGHHEAADRLGFSSDAIGLHEASEIIARLKYPAPSLPIGSRRSQIDKRAAYIRKKFLRARLGQTAFIREEVA